MRARRATTRRRRWRREPSSRGAIIGYTGAMAKGKLAALIVGLVLLAGATLYRRSDRSLGARVATGSLKNDNVLLITLDTTRADHLPAYGYKNDRDARVLDRLAETSLIFDDAIAQVPLTLPSHTSILTGPAPHRRTAFATTRGTWSTRKVIIARAILKGGGYATGGVRFGVRARLPLRAEPGIRFLLRPVRRVSRGQSRSEIQRRRRGDRKPRSRSWLPANKDKRFFCWVHFYDPH